jgi:predicted GNAT family acetyltransferase
MVYRLEHAPARGRYELVDEGGVVAFASIEERGRDTVIYHTEVVRSRRGRGIGGELVARVLQDLRERDRRAVPACSFVRRFVAEHPGYSDVLA